MHKTQGTILVLPRESNKRREKLCWGSGVHKTQGTILVLPRESNKRREKLSWGNGVHKTQATILVLPHICLTRGDRSMRWVQYVSVSDTTVLQLYHNCSLIVLE